MRRALAILILFVGPILVASADENTPPNGSSATREAIPPAPALDTINTKTYDLVIVGGTPGGIAMAVRAAREGLTVLLVNHNQHLGGMLTNGLGVWDTLYDGRRAPIYDELRANIVAYYSDTYGPDSQQCKASMPGPPNTSNRGYYEPHVAEEQVERLVRGEPTITVLKGFDPISTARDGALLRSVTLREFGGNRKAVATGKVFADCTYEGDLAAIAKVPYRVGRESRAEYNEPHAGIVFMGEKGAENSLPKFPRDAIEGRLNLRGFRVTADRLYPGSTGDADGAVQAFNFRICLTSDPANRILPDKPPNYHRDAFVGKGFVGGKGGGPNGKESWNEPKLSGEHHGYPDGDWVTRDAITQRHREYALGWIYFVQHDESVPAESREQYRKVGLPKDEFIDNGHVPYEMYVREARRIVGRYVFTENDALPAPALARAPLHPDSIAITEWPMDSHECTARRGPEGGRDGKVLLCEETRPGQVPYRCLLPQGIDNLLVPVCLSSTHIGWGTIRLEPTWMNIGESAGYAAALAVNSNQPPAAIDVDKLLRTLADRRVMITFFNDVDVAAKDDWIPAVQYFGSKGFFDSYDARPNQPLPGALAEYWVATWAKLVARETFDPVERLQGLTRTASPPGASVRVQDLVNALAAAHANQGAIDAARRECGLELGAHLTRAEGCRLMYHALAKIK